ncbi:MAG: hypothetical protein OEV43_10235 [Coriobacteriia bacterium]|nr:hypothetical protein [Coriobacteriia bacterium]
MATAKPAEKPAEKPARKPAAKLEKKPVKLSEEQRRRRRVAKLVVAVLAVSLALTVAVELLAAQRYRAHVQVVEGDTIGVNPLTESLDFGDLPPGAEQKRFVTLENTGSRSAYIVVWSVGGIGELMDVDRSRFALGPGETARIEFSVSVPPSAPVKKYSGTVFIFRLPRLWS